MIGLTGALLAYSAGYISPATYGFGRVDVSVLVIVAFGGLGTLLGTGDRRHGVRGPRPAVTAAASSAKCSTARSSSRSFSVSDEAS